MATSETTARQAAGAAGATGLAAVLVVGYAPVAVAPLAIVARQESGGSFLAGRFA